MKVNKGFMYLILLMICLGVMGMSFGQSSSLSSTRNAIKTYKEKIIELRLQKQTLNTQKTLLLEYSLENQLLNYTAQVATYLSLDINENDVWKRAFATLEDFQNKADDELVNLAGSYSMILQYL